MSSNATTAWKNMFGAYSDVINLKNKKNEFDNI